MANAAKNTPGGGRKPPNSAYDLTVGALTGNLLGRKRRTSNGRTHRETWRFVCYLDRIPPHILEDDFTHVRGIERLSL